MNFFQAIVLGVLQGITELFPISSLGHSVVVPSLFGWNSVVAAQSQQESFFLAFLVGMHVATALALLAFFWRDWVEIIAAMLRSIQDRCVDDPRARLGWLLVVATVPAGIVGLAFEHKLRTGFAKPFAASVLLFVNGFVLLAGDWARRRAEARELASAKRVDNPHSRELETLEYREAGVIGVFQVFALFPGISRSGITMVTGLFRGLNYEDAARFSFLLATPIIFAAGVYKIPDLLGPDGNGVRGQILAGSVAAAISAYLSVRFLMRFFRTHNLMPFALYCLLMGGALTINFA